MNILVVGGTKFIGPHAVRQLVDRGHAVTIYHRGETETDLPPVVRHVHDAAAAIPVVSFPPILATSPVDVVSHMIPMGERDAQAAMDTFRGTAKRIVALSSYNVGEADTPTVAERLARLPPAPGIETSSMVANFEQHIAYDTTRIRRELGYRELVDEEEGLRRTVCAR